MSINIIYIIILLIICYFCFYKDKNMIKVQAEVNNKKIY